MRQTKSPRFAQRRALVSVVLPVYNADKYLPHALDSIRRQSYRNIEIICVDDASTDKSGQILKTYRRKYRRFRIFRLDKQQSVGAVANFAIAKARGKYVCRMDADDVMLKERIEKQVAFLEKNSDIIALGGQCRLIDKNGKTISYYKLPLQHEEIIQQLLYRSALVQPTLMVNQRKLPESFRWYNTDQKIAEDIDLLYRLSSCGKLANLPDKILLYRRHEQTLWHKQAKEGFRLALKSRFTALTRYGEKASLRAAIQLVLTFCQTFLLPRPRKIWQKISRELDYFRFTLPAKPAK